MPVWRAELPGSLPPYVTAWLPQGAAAYALGVNSYIVKPVEFEKFIDVAAQIDLYWCVLNQRSL